MSLHPVDVAGDLRRIAGRHDVVGRLERRVDQPPPDRPAGVGRRQLEFEILVVGVTDNVHLAPARHPDEGGSLADYQPEHAIHYDAPRPPTPRNPGELEDEAAERAADDAADRAALAAEEAREAEEEAAAVRQPAVDRDAERAAFRGASKPARVFAESRMDSERCDARVGRDR